ncbi:Protein Y71H2AM.14 b [Aphelenchoides avenae]|nr:Protein Y71H2AM.14 b [Aphelenchus avenae]
MDYGLGNKMYQMATLYGIGRTLNRQPYFHRNNKNQQGDLAEILENFPNMFGHLRIMLPKENETKYVEFVNGCCEYEDPSRLKNESATYISLSSEYVQSYKFFHPYRKEIISLFDFGYTMRKEADDYVATTLPDLKERHALCIHIRRGDFIAHEFLESTKEFVEAAVEFVVKREMEKNTSTQFKAILLGQDEGFMKSLTFPLASDEVHIHGSLRRGSDLYFGSHYCDSIIISASGSTFAFWMSYLNQHASVFYNGQVTDDPQKMLSFVKDRDMFPEEWIRLMLRNGTARHEAGWWH